MDKPQDDKSIERQMYQLHKKGYEDISKAIEKSSNKDVQIFPKSDDDEDFNEASRALLSVLRGPRGYTPKKGIEYFTKEEQDAFVVEIMSKIRIPKDGKDGKDADPVDYAKIETFVKKEVAKIPKPTEIKPIDIDSVVESVLNKIPKIEPVDYSKVESFVADKQKAIEQYVDETIRKLDIPSQLAHHRSLTNSAGPRTRLEEMVDIDATGIQPNQVLKWTGSKWIPTDISGGGGGYTNLTEFVDQTPWRLFYSNGDGDVTELALGADGTFLKSNGATAAPAFAVPAGSGAVDSVNGQTGVVVLDTDDIADTATNRYTNDTDIARLANTSGTNTGDQTITLTGDVTGTGTGSFATTIANDAVTNAKMANMATKTYKGRTAGTTGDPEDVAVATLKTDLALVKGDVGLGNVDNTSNATERAATRTLENARITKRVTSETSSATPTINTDNTDVHKITALAENITSMTTNLSGTPTDWQILAIEIVGTATRTIVWEASFADGGLVGLPLTTNGTVPLKVLLQYGGGVWNCLAVA